jgi:hypothetical protein
MAKTEVIKLLFSRNEGIYVGICDGIKTIAKSSDTFTTIGPSFFSSPLYKQAETNETLIEIFEVVKESTLLSEIFKEIKGSFESFCFTENQIDDFCKFNKDFLNKNEGSANFFLYKIFDDFFICQVVVTANGLSIHRYKLGDDMILKGKYRHRVMIPV